MHGLCLTTFAVTVLPEMPSAIARACTTPDKLSAAPLAVPADGAASQATQGGAFVHLISAGLASLDNGPSPVEAKHAAEPVEVSASATLVATVATTATRRLQEMVAHVPEPHAACARTTRLFDSSRNRSASRLCGSAGSLAGRRTNWLAGWKPAPDH